MGFHRQVDQRLFGDKKYLELSPEKPSGRGLWKHLLIGPHHVGLPGLFAVGRAALAESLGWPLGQDHSLDPEPTFTSCWNEIARLGMAEADWPARVIFIPSTFRQECNRPRNPNILVNWRTMFDSVPESPLRDRWVRALGSHCTSRGGSFPATFTALWNDSGNHSLNDLGDCRETIAGIGNGNGNGITHTGLPATKKQIAFVRSMLRRAGRSVEDYLAGMGRDFLVADDVDDVKASVAAHVGPGEEDGIPATVYADLDFEHGEGGERGARAWIEGQKPEYRDRLISRLETMIGGSDA